MTFDAPSNTKHAAHTKCVEQHSICRHRQWQDPTGIGRREAGATLKSTSPHQSADNTNGRNPLAVSIQTEKGSATVPVALFGVSPNKWFYSPFGAPRRALPARRRDADESGRDDRVPHLQPNGSGLEVSVLGCTGG